MGLHDHKCDSCESVVDVLFPIAILEELPTGGSQMVRKWYCIECKTVIEDEAEEAEEEEDEPKADRKYPCGCIFQQHETQKYIWLFTGECGKHWKDATKVREDYDCGCIIMGKEDIYVYIEVCEEHE